MNPAPTTTRTDIARAVAEAVAEILPAVPVAEITGRRHLKDLGADSVDRVEIILTLLDRLGVELPLSRFADLPNLDAVIDLLHGEGGPR
ncbi:MAG TPA: phosphopantetheine-binding protein [Actinocrinis sp.]|nr:phosphopantetheine-binding protein [Actinocrinis sp.]